jgi:Glycosyl transferase family 2
VRHRRPPRPQLLHERGRPRDDRDEDGHRGPDASGHWVNAAAADLLAQHLVGAISANAARREPLRLVLVVAMALRVSVILPYYNRADTLLEASRSVLEQTHGDLMLYLVDHRSTDGSQRDGPIADR